MLRKILAVIAGLLAVVVLAAVVTAPSAIVHVPNEPTISGGPDSYLATAEATVAAATPIIPGAEKRVRWFEGVQDRRTEYVLVYLHGFSATRQETAPVSEMIADSLQANLFETRLSGHGLVSDALAGVTAEQWLDDAIESLAIAKTLGDKIVLIGTSTGATLALAIVDHPLFDAVDSIVMISPNFSPFDPTSDLLTRPGGPQLAQFLVGETRSWTAANEQQERYWSTTYPTAALVEMMRLVDLANEQLPLTLEQSVLTLYSPNDQVVSVERMQAALARIDSPRMDTVALEGSGDPSNHVLAGNILAPENNAAVAGHIVRFLTASDL